MVLGALYGLLTIVWIDFEWLENVLVANIRSNTLLILTYVLAVGHFAYSIGTFYLSRSRLEGSTTLIARPECPNCLEKIMVSQGQNHSQVMILFAFTIGIILNFKYGEGLLRQPQNGPISKNESNFKIQLARIGLVLLSLVPCGIVWALFRIYRIKDDFSIASCIFEYIMMSSVYLLAGVILMRYTPQLWRRFGVHLERDFVVNYVTSSNRIRLYYSP